MITATYEHLSTAEKSPIYVQRYQESCRKSVNHIGKVAALDGLPLDAPPTGSVSLATGGSRWLGPHCNLTAQQSHARLRTAFGNKAPFKMAIYNWFAEFKPGLVNLSDEVRDGRSSTAVDNKYIDAVRRMIETDRHVTYHEIRTSLGIGMSQIQSILQKHLDISNPTFS
ncbi:Putative uncharacterized protein FLJ37770 [Eumeta japonica]|uniref:Mos1 transposase HTH domain-containing protein n=1 Tax=Eumeta variegata TaxID=151549 RepID=A0A4C1ZGA4_EUMVA|nr:Putative uncharacterized protein FLJ37770 [Eumeta japonica]